MPGPLYKIKEEIVRIDLFDIRLLRIININELYDLFDAKPADDIEVMDERIPYWADLWPSAIASSRFLVENNIIAEKMAVLEIGCGLGLPGVVAGRLGAEVTFTDYLSEPLEFAKKNWDMNNDRHASFQIIDWRNIPPGINADIILASDVAYENRSFGFLINFIKRMTSEGKIVLLSEPGRMLAASFIKELHNTGLIKKDIPYIIPRNNIENKVTVYELRK